VLHNSFFHQPAPTTAHLKQLLINFPCSQGSSNCISGGQLLVLLLLLLLVNSMETQGGKLLLSTDAAVAVADAQSSADGPLSTVPAPQRPSVPRWSRAQGVGLLRPWQVWVCDTAAADTCKAPPSLHHLTNLNSYRSLQSMMTQLSRRTQQRRQLDHHHHKTSRCGH
jgi:hypothetical protein